MNIESLPEKVEKLESVFLNILYLKPEERIISPDMSLLGDLKNAINGIFEDNTCINVLFTHNTDKQFFGIKINPNMSPSDASIILSTEERVKLDKYQIEFDSKLFDIGLDESELAAITIYEISSMMDSYELFDNIRVLVDGIVVEDDDVVNIRDSVNHAQLIIFALKDTMYKLSSFMFKEDAEDLLMNAFIQASNLQNSIVSAKEKIDNSNSSAEFTRSSKTVILKWMFIMYRNMKINSRIVTETLRDAKAFTASKLDISEIDKTLNAVERIDNSILTNESVDLNKFFDNKNISSLNEIGIFKSLKKNGLRGIENDLYEYAMRVKNCTESEDAYMIMRGINTRLGILEDYLATEPNLSDHDRNHWSNVAQQYRELRIILSKKKFKEKQYGLFFDYSALDKLDKREEDEE